jgi:hypothetical protein
MLSKPADGLPADAVDLLLASRTRPAWSPATIRSEHDSDVVHVETLCWGVHEMLRQLFANGTQAKAADDTARVLLG